MAEPRHILLCGDRGVGKSTLINRLLTKSTRPVYGFRTRRLHADDAGPFSVYIAPAAAGNAIFETASRADSCSAVVHRITDGVFDALGVQYVSQAQPDGVIVMDELGFMEAKSEAFVRAVFGALDGDVPVIAAVKARYDVPFLNEVRAHKNGRLVMIDPENRDALYNELLPVIENWNLEAEGE